MVEDVSTRLAEVRRRINAAADRVGRRADEVTVMAVTKTHSQAAVRAAVEAGVRVIGENRVGEAQEKLGPAPHDYDLHLVGHLQRNKAKIAAAVFDCVQSIDKPETAATLARRCAGDGRAMRVYLEYNTSGELAKSGVESEGELLALAEAVLRHESLVFEGLMTVGPLTTDGGRVRRAFHLLYDLRERVLRNLPEIGGLELSMGMSGDFEIAVEEGATMVRLGTVLFGPRGDR